MTALLQVFLRLVALKRLGVLLFVLAATLCASSNASAFDHPQTKTRVWGFDLAAHSSSGSLAATTSGKHQGNRVALSEVASGSLLAAEGVATRVLTAADLGLSGRGITNLAGEVVNAGTTRIVSVGNITASKGALVGELRGALPNILNAARAEGVQTLQISATFANPGLRAFAASQAARYGGSFASAGGQETLTFLLGVP